MLIDGLDWSVLPVDYCDVFTRCLVSVVYFASLSDYNSVFCVYVTVKGLTRCCTLFIIGWLHDVLTAGCRY